MTAGSGQSCRPGSASDVIDGHRLVYRADSLVNWCPGLGTVLANEEVTSDGRSDRGNFPVFRKRLRQWMMRITAYSDRLLDDLDVLDWPDKVKAMQRNWIGRSTGATALFSATKADGSQPTSRCSPPGRTPCSAPPIWCWRPSTTWSTSWSPPRGRTGSTVRWTYGACDTSARRWPPTGARSRRSRTSSGRRARRRPASSSAATPPTRPTVNRYRSSSPTTCWPDTAPGRSWPCRATTNGTGISPRQFGLPIVEVIAGGDISQAAYTGDGVLVNSGYLDGMEVAAGEGGHHRPAGGRGPGPGPCRIQVEGLAVRAAAILG